MGRAGGKPLGTLQRVKARADLYTETEAIKDAKAMISHHSDFGQIYSAKDKRQIIQIFKNIYEATRKNFIDKKDTYKETKRATEKIRTTGKRIKRPWEKEQKLREFKERRKQLQKEAAYKKKQDAELILDVSAEEAKAFPVQQVNALGVEEMPGLRQPRDRTGGAIGDYLIIDLQPYSDSLQIFNVDEEVRRSVITDLQEIHMEVQTAVWNEIGTGSQSDSDYGKVPKETGALRRSMRASVQKNNANVPDSTTSPFDIRLTIWLWANKPYAEEVSRMATSKVAYTSKPAVQHPFNLPKAPWQDWSRKTGKRKRDPGARNDYFNRVLEVGRRAARRAWNGKPQLKTFFKEKIGTDRTEFEHIALARNL